MKYSFMTFSCPELSLDDVLALAKRFGYDGVEPRIDEGHKHGIERKLTAAERKAVRKKAAGSGVALSCVATSHRFSDPAKADAEVKGTIESARLAADVGAPCVRVFGGPIAKGIARPKAIDNLVARLTEVSDGIRGLPVVICLETHDDWCDPAHVAEVIRRVNRPEIAVNWDFMHPVNMAKKSVAESFSTLKDWIRHVHFHDGNIAADGNRTLAAMGTGMIDHFSAVQLLKKASYGGYLSGEWIQWEPYETHLPRELAAMKRYEQGA
jgi:sugar phosphate isomerase/epimerase